MAWKLFQKESDNIVCTFFADFTCILSGMDTAEHRSSDIFERPSKVLISFETVLKYSEDHIY
jgi:hypothetical protein